MAYLAHSFRLIVVHSFHHHGVGEIDEIANLIPIPCDDFADHVEVQPLKAMLVGGQAVANLEHYCFDRAHSEGFAFHVANGNVGMPQINTTFLNLDLLYDEIHISYVPSLNSKAIVAYEDLLETVRPQVVIMDRMVEDLAFLTEFEYPSTVSNEVVDMAWRAFHHYDVPVVMALSAIRRETDMNCSVPTYQMHMETANNALRGQVNICSS